MLFWTSQECIKSEKEKYKRYLFQKSVQINYLYLSDNNRLAICTPCKNWSESKSRQCNYSLGNMEKCYFFDKGFCKLKSQCLMKHTSTDCNGQCENKNSCPSRHRVEWKNGKKCNFSSSNFFEFLHNEKPNVGDTILENIQYTIGQIKVNITNIEDQIMTMNTAITQTQTRMSAMGKDVYTNNQMENIVKQL